MPQGLQIWNAAGELILDTSTRNGVVIGSTIIGTNPYSGDITIPEGATNTIWFLCTPTAGSGYPYNPVITTPNSTTLHWEATSAARLIYGVF